MLGPHDVGVHDTGGGVQGIHGWVDAQLSDGTGQHRGGVQVGKGGGRGRVSQVIGWHINSLGTRRGGDSQCQAGDTAPWDPGVGPALTCTEVMEPLRVVVMRSCMVPMSVASVGW